MISSGIVAVHRSKSEIETVVKSIISRLLIRSKTKNIPLLSGVRRAPTLRTFASCFKYIAPPERGN